MNTVDAVTFCHEHHCLFTGRAAPEYIGATCVGKKPNFGFEKRQKDLKKQQKREEKAEKKRLKQELARAETPVDGMAVPPEEGE